MRMEGYWGNEEVCVCVCRTQGGGLVKSGVGGLGG